MKRFKYNHYNYTLYLIGLFIAFMGAIGIDSEPPAYGVFLTLTIIGAILMFINLIGIWVYKKHRADKEMDRLLEKYKKDYPF